MNGIPVKLNNLPIYIICYENGWINFQKDRHKIATVVDQPEQGVQAIIDDDGISIGANTEVEYGLCYEYKSEPELLAWLKAQNLQFPF